ncbi:hypothetical protein [Baaleninema simplex]|uniref:hypothetical protein n=1 Tax=Baaleninema simplex TaxID=2862350 RepID=UPI001181A10C|nr:hypothetical protein [Baaleninema simplex]
MKTFLQITSMVILAVGACTISGESVLAAESSPTGDVLLPRELSEYEPDVEPGVPTGPGSGSRCYE